jgi:hypothetical protein
VEVSLPADAWEDSVVDGIGTSRSFQASSAYLCAAVVGEQPCWQAIAMSPGVTSRRGMSKWSRSAQVAAVKGHSSKSATRLYTENSSAVPRSSCSTTIFTPVQHLQNKLALRKTFGSNK